MQKYQIGDYRILNAIPSSFQISTKNNSYKLFQTNPDPEAEYPIPITFEDETINENHVLMYTTKLYMRVVWIDDEYDPNGQIEIGLRMPDASIEFGNWTTLANGIPKEVIQLAIKTIQDPDSVQQYKVPLYVSRDETNNTPPPPPPPKVKKWKKRVFNKTAKQPQRRLRND